MSTENEKSLFILDSYGLIYREYYAFIKRPLTNKNGENISAVHGFFNNLALTLKNFKPTMMAVALDSRTPTFRHTDYPQYKANRAETPDDLKAQFPWIENVLSSLGMKAIRADGFEADDIIATLSKKAEAKGYKVFILSGDKDLLQLVNDNIRILRPGKVDKTKMWEEVDSNGVLQEWGVPPDKICDVLSLTGDTADNVPGVKGVGDKTAVKFITQYGSVEGLYEHADEIKGAIGEKVRGDKENAFFSKKLISLRYDVPLMSLTENTENNDFDFDSLLIEKLDYQKASDELKAFSLHKVSGMFSELALGTTLQLEAEQVKINVGNYKAVTDKKELCDYVQKSIKEKKVAFDTETDGLDTRTCNIIGFSLSCQKGSGIYVPLILNNEEDSAVKCISKKDAFDSLRLLFESDVTIVMHNAKFDLQVLFNNGLLSDFNKKLVNQITKTEKSKAQSTQNELQFDLFADDLFSEEKESNEVNEKAKTQNNSGELFSDDELFANQTVVSSKVEKSILDEIDSFDKFFESKAKIFDTMIAAWVIEPDRSEKTAFSLETLAEKTLKLKGIEFAELVEKGKTFADVPLSKAFNYGAEDSDFTLQLFDIFKETLQNEKLNSVFETEMKILPILSKMEMRGIHFDCDILRNYDIELSKSLKEIQENIYETAGHPFNISSPRQLGVVLFEEMGLKGKKKTKSGGYSTDEETLIALGGNAFVDKVLDFRSKSKLLSTYVEALPELVDENNRIHTSFMQTGTATGRLSSRDPNLQNIPIREEEGRRIRNAFTAPNGKVLITADYSQIELVVLAHLSEDENLCKAFNEGVDVHKSTASLIYGVDIDMVTPEQRRNAKTFNFGIMYGMSAFRLSNDLKISYHEAADFINTYFEIYCGVRDYFEKTIKLAEDTGFTTTISGRRREIKNISASNQNIREAAIRMAKNSPIQGSAADIVKKAMLDVDSALKETKLNAKLLLQIHDELIFECDDNEEEISNAIALIKDKMEHAFKLSVPLKVSVEYGKTWGEFH